MTGWAAFWLLCCVFVVCEAVIALNGIDTLLWKFRTAPELAIQRKLSGTDVP